MWWHPLASIAVGSVVGHLIARWRLRRRREIEAWKHRQRMRG